MAFCGKCGASVAEGVSFCGRCGTPISQGTGNFAPPPLPPPPPSPYYAPAPIGGTTAPGMVARITNILTKPKVEWPVIAGESTSVSALYSGYIILLAAIPAVAGFFQMSMLGMGIFRIPMTTALVASIVSYALSLGGVYLSAFIIDKLANNFQSQPSLIQALKLVAYSYTAVWVAGILNILPVIGVLGVLAGGIYSIYLFYLGLPVMMRTPPDKVIVYMIVSAIVIFVIYLAIGMVVGSITAAAFLTGASLGG